MKSLFLACALALPAANFHDDGGYVSKISKNAFMKEYHAIHALLEKSFPRNEFMFIHTKVHHRAMTGWVIVPMRWRGHIIYRRPLKESA